MCAYLCVVSALMEKNNRGNIVDFLFQPFQELVNVATIGHTVIKKQCNIQIKL